MCDIFSTFPAQYSLTLERNTVAAMEMNNTRFLVTGASGFLGWNICRHFLDMADVVVGTYNASEPDHYAANSWVRSDLTSCDPAELYRQTMPDVVVHCAAVSSRAGCEADPEMARAVNVEAPARFAAACADAGIRMIHISTDLVFDGTAPPYAEHARISPISLYGEMKAAAESEVFDALPGCIVLRTALMYGPAPGGVPGSFFRWTLDALRSGELLTLYTNQVRTPLYAPDVATVIEALLRRDTAGGVYHLGGPDRLTRYEIGMRIAKEYDLPTDRIVPTLLERPFPLSAMDDTSLDSTLIRSLTGVRLHSFDSGLQAIRSIHG